jgi:hypothetical protein
MVNTIKQAPILPYAFRDTPDPLNAKHRHQRWAPQVSFDEQSLFVGRLRKGTCKIGRNRALAFLRDCARNEHFLQWARSPEIS